MKLTTEQVIRAIDEFLESKYLKKAEKELKKLEKAKQEQDHSTIAELQDALAKIKGTYTKSAWISNAAENLTRQLSFGTHISKGIHPDSKGDNINFRSSSCLPDGIVGSRTIRTLPLDATGNAAALPLAAFFNIVVDETKNILLRDLIQAENPALEGVFSKDTQQSRQYAAQFKQSLDNVITHPETHTKNKQLLWPHDNATEENNYTCLIPLYPSSFTHHFFGMVNDWRYSEQNKTARKNRGDEKKEQQPYLTLKELAFLKLGGTKPQNISQLTSGQGGRNFLLPSLPPVFHGRYLFSLSKSAITLFGKPLIRFCQRNNEGLENLFNVVKAKKNLYEIRELRKQAVNDILDSIIQVALSIQEAYPPGWSHEYKLSPHEKCWLDPHRAELEGEEDFAEYRQKDDWLNEIKHRFAAWLNAILKARFKAISHNFADPEFEEWLNSIHNAIKLSVKKGEEVFT